MRFPSKKFCRRLHLYLGLSVGILLVLIALTGSALVFYIEIDEILHPQIQTDELNNKPNWDQALTTLRRAYPDKTGSWRFEVPQNSGTIPARYYNPAETQGHHFAPMMVWLSKDGQHILRREYWGDFLMTWLYNLHFTLLMGATGSWVVGYIGLVSVFLLISGLVSWWPKNGQWLKNIRFKARSNQLSLLYDWHKVLGLISLIPLLVLFATGTMLALPKETDAVLKLSLGQVNYAKKTLAPSQNPQANQPEFISISQAVATAKQKWPEAKLAWIETPNAVNYSQYRLRFQLSRDPSRRFPHSYIEVDAQTGELTSVFNTEQQGAANIVKDWLHPLHDGNFNQFFGDSQLAKTTVLSIRIIWLLSGISVMVLFVLGLIRWWIKSSKKPKN